MQRRCNDLTVAGRADEGHGGGELDFTSRVAWCCCVFLDKNERRKASAAAASSSFERGYDF
jgi:hypothetical protein